MTLVGAFNAAVVLQADNPQLYSSFNTKLGEAAKQSTLTAGITASDAIKPDVPEGLTSETWAALQKTAKELDVRGRSFLQEQVLIASSANVAS